MVIHVYVDLRLGILKITPISIPTIKVKITRVSKSKRLVDVTKIPNSVFLTDKKIHIFNYKEIRFGCAKMYDAPFLGNNGRIILIHITLVFLK